MMKTGSMISRIKDRYKLRSAVKEALDTLPTAVCYFTDSGTVKLCNATMYELFRKITQRDLQSFAELREALEKCDGTNGIWRDKNVFLFPDGRAWQYSAARVQTAEGEEYTEVVFSNVTALYEKRQKLQQQSAELKKMYRELKKLSENVQEMTREQEILNLKSRLHDQMNMGVAAIRQILRQNTTSEENAAAVIRFCRAIEVLQEENAYPQDDMAEFIRDAGVSGIQVEITGELPEQEAVMPLLLQSMREACVNAARHADATILYVDVRMSQDTITLCMKNDGRQPEREIVPRGGLADLGRRVAQAGGSLQIQAQPVFALTVTLPLDVQK